MNIDNILLAQLDIINNCTQILVKAEPVLTIPTILEYIETIYNNYGDKEFLKVIKNYYQLDSGSILLDNLTSVSNWDIGGSWSATPNTYLINYNPEDKSVNLIHLDKNNQITKIDLDNSEDVNVKEIIKIGGLTKFENLKSTIKNISLIRIINSDKCQLPSVRVLNGKVALDYTIATSQIDVETKTFILNLMIRPLLTNEENITLIKTIVKAIKGN